MEVRSARPAETEAGLALVASYATGPPARAVAILHEAADRGEINLANLTVAVEGDRLLGACLGIVAPGRTAFLTVPGVAEEGLERQVMVALLGHWRQEAVARDIAIVQVFLSPGDQRRQEYLRAAGYTFLADLVYLQRDVGKHTGEGEMPPGLAWRTYAERSHATFGHVIRQTYIQTLDCPQLEGLRSMEDILAGHKAQGEFDPNRWFLLERDDEAVGVLLLNGIPERQSLDITYMGLIPAARGRLLGAALVQQALNETRRAGRARLTCAVDALNRPAIKTYSRFDFRPMDRKQVFIAVPQPPTGHRRALPGSCAPC